MPGLVPGIQPSASNGVCGTMDPGDKHRDDTFDAEHHDPRTGPGQRRQPERDLHPGCARLHAAVRHHARGELRPRRVRHARRLRALSPDERPALALADRHARRRARHRRRVDGAGMAGVPLVLPAHVREHDRPAGPQHDDDVRRRADLGRLRAQHSRHLHRRVHPGRHHPPRRPARRGADCGGGAVGFLPFHPPHPRRPRHARRRPGRGDRRDAGRRHAPHLQDRLLRGDPACGAGRRAVGADLCRLALPRRAAAHDGVRRRDPGRHGLDSRRGAGRSDPGLHRELRRHILRRSGVGLPVVRRRDPAADRAPWGILGTPES